MEEWAVMGRYGLLWAARLGGMDGNGWERLVGTRTITWTRPMGAVSKLHREPLVGDLVAKIEAALAYERDSLDDWLVLETERPGLWPDQLRDDPVEPGEDAAEEESPTDYAPL